MHQSSCLNCIFNFDAHYDVVLLERCSSRRLVYRSLCVELDFFFDFGIGNGLRNDLTYALNKGDSERARVVISSSVIFLGAIVIALIPLGVAVSAFVP